MCPTIKCINVNSPIWAGPLLMLPPDPPLLQNGGAQPSLQWQFPSLLQTCSRSQIQVKSCHHRLHHHHQVMSAALIKPFLLRDCCRFSGHRSPSLAAGLRRWRTESQCRSGNKPTNQQGGWGEVVRRGGEDVSPSACLSRSSLSTTLSLPFLPRRGCQGWRSQGPVHRGPS